MAYDFLFRWRWKNILKRISDASIVVQPSKDREWMSKSVAFQKIIRDRLFFSAQSSAGKWIIASGKFDGGDLKNLEPVELKADFKLEESVTPNILETQRGFVMVFAGRKTKSESRRLFVARSESLDGPWELTTQTYVAHQTWEGRNIDLGPGNYIINGTGYFFYSSAYPSLQSLALSLLKSPRMPTRSNLMRFQRRRIGMLRMDLQKTEIIGASGEPLSLDCTPNTAFESVFCPGFIHEGNRYFLFVTGSNYSQGFPFDQVIGVTESERPPDQWTGLQSLSPIIRSADLTGPLSSHTAFDTPDPVLEANSTITLYFSAMSRDDSAWHILKCKLILSPR